ncbi:hypothetical protein [Haloarcula rubra]|nr:hypothetical protein [Halomicroarcula rubra]
MPVSHPPDTDTLIQAFIETYKTSSEATPVELVRQYHEVTKYTAKNPNKGSTAVASALNLPRSRIRSWVDGDGRPDAVRGMQKAQRNGWFNLDWDSPTLQTLNVLVAWIFSGGSINDNWVPALTVTDETRSVATEALDRIGTGSVAFREADDGRATELRPATDASVLGRLLYALGAPKGVKSSETPLSLPLYLLNGPEHLRLAFARTYVINRGTKRPDRPQSPVQIAEERDTEFQQEIRTFIQSVTNGQAVHGDAPSWRLSAAAAYQLDQPPDIPDGSTDDTDR